MPMNRARGPGARLQMKTSASANSESRKNQ